MDPTRLFFWGVKNEKFPRTWATADGLAGRTGTGQPPLTSPEDNRITGSRRSTVKAGPTTCRSGRRFRKYIHNFLSFVLVSLRPPPVLFCFPCPSAACRVHDDRYNSIGRNHTGRCCSTKLGLARAIGGAHVPATRARPG